MKRFAYLMLCLMLPVAATGADTGKADKVAARKVFSGYVVSVADGDTLTMQDGTKVRLLDINTPEIDHKGGKSEPYAREAADYLRRMVDEKYVTIETGPKDKDRYGRILGQVYLENGGWVNGTMVRDGYAHVYTFADNAMYPAELLRYETQAREGRRGLWVLDRWTVRKAGDCCARGDIGTFKLVEGRVLAAVTVKDKGRERVYLNFGPEWRTDFSVFVDKKDLKWFKKAGIKDVAEHYRGKQVRVRGYLQPVNGVLVRVTHPAQIEIVN